MSRDIFKKNFDKIYKVYGDRDVDTELIAMTEMITDSTELIRQGEKRDVRNMCIALEELKNEERQESVRESAVKLPGKGFSVPEVANLLELMKEEAMRM